MTRRIYEGTIADGAICPELGDRVGVAPARAATEPISADAMLFWFYEGQRVRVIIEPAPAPAPETEPCPPPADRETIP